MMSVNVKPECVRLKYGIFLSVFMMILSLPSSLYGSPNQILNVKKSSTDYPIARYLLKVTPDLNSHTNEVKSLPELTLTKGDRIKVVNNCQAYLKHLPAWDVQEGDNNMRISADYQTCIANYIFKHARPSHYSGFRNDFSDLIYDNLLISSFPSSLHNQTDENKDSLKKLGLKLTHHSETSILFKQEGWEYRFDLLAKGDFNHDGNEDLLVQFIDKAIVGNYFGVEILVLTKPPKDKFWRAQEGVSFLRSMVEVRKKI
jgi:hypothetical protein